MEPATTADTLATLLSTAPAIVSIAVIGIVAIVFLLKYIRDVHNERISEYKQALDRRDEHAEKTSERFYQMHSRTVEVLPEISHAVERNTKAVEDMTRVVTRCEQTR